MSNAEIEFTTEERQQLHNAVAFLLIFMGEYNASLSEWTPEYILQKYQRYMNNPRDFAHMWGLHPRLAERLEMYFERHEIPLLKPEGWEE